VDVLAWLEKAKTNRDIADILGMSPRTVNKHLKHTFVKLGVETRSAVAALSVSWLHGTPEVCVNFLTIRSLTSTLVRYR
jgi:DNA-binding CsgD family transcriptional regulator